MTVRRPDLTTDAWRKLRLIVLDRDGWRCTACGRPVEGADATVDHLLPYTGPESNAMHNLVTLCRSCNSTKQDRIQYRIDYANRRWISHV